MKDSFWRITIDTNPEDCNLHCIMCEEHSPHSNYIEDMYRDTGIRKRRMELSILNSVLNQAKELGVLEIIPSTMGEPLLYRYFEEIVKFVSENKIKLNLTTNGSFPKKDINDWASLIIPITSDIKISWNASNSDLAQKIMIGINFEKALSNVKELIRYRDHYFAETGYYCKITFQLTFMKSNMTDVPEIIKLASQLNIDRVKGHQLWTHFSELKELSIKEDKNAILTWNKIVEDSFYIQENYRKPNGDKVLLENFIPIMDTMSEIPYEYECPFLNKEIWISATGKISPCCAPDKLRDSLGDFGNIEEKSLKEVINDEMYRSLVENYKKISLCKTCNMRRPISNEKR